MREVSGIKDLAETLRDSGISKTGSSSWGFKFAQTCTNVRNWMIERHGIYQLATTEMTHIPFEKIFNDPSGQLYFGGWCQLSDADEWRRINPTAYLEMFLSDHTGIDDETLELFNEMCEVYNYAMTEGIKHAKPYVDPAFPDDI